MANFVPQEKATWRVTLTLAGYQSKPARVFFLIDGADKAAGAEKRSSLERAIRKIPSQLVQNHQALYCYGFWVKVRLRCFRSKTLEAG